MSDDLKILKTITETADMGRDSLNHIIDKATNLQLKSALQKQFNQYDEIYKDAQQILCENGESPHKITAPLKIYSHMVSNIKTMTAENANSKIAEMVIQGNTMGIIEMIKHINNYNSSNEELLKLSQKLIQTQQDNIEGMKQYL